MGGSRKKSINSGIAAELAVATELSRRDHAVSWPIGNSEKYDLIITSPAGKLYRIQVKSAVLNVHKTYKVGFTYGHGSKHTYSTSDVDVIVVFLPYDSDYDDIYLPGFYVIPLKDLKHSVGNFYPPSHGRWPTWVCKYEKYRNNWSILV